MSDLFSIESLLRIFFITGVLGCGCAWLAGRAIALTWRPLPMVLGAAVLMGLAVRFVHFALFGEPLTPLTLVIETAILFLVTLLAYRRTRARQMVQQYYWLYEAHGLLGWRPRQDKG
ncbi:MAG: DUF6867 family protein [Pseudomonadota bacterium]|jgi:hypothetical protein